MSDDAIIGSVGVAVVPNASRFWEDFKAKTQGGSEAASPSVRVKADTGEAQSKVAALRSEIDATSANVKVNADTKDAQFQMHLLRDAIIGIGPAAIPVAAVAGGALLGLLPVAATVALAVGGISKQMKSGGQSSTEFAKNVSALKAEVATLQHTAASGILTGLNTAIGASAPLFKTINADVAVMSSQLGHIVAASAPALVQILTELNPLFVTFGNVLVGGADHLAQWAKSSTGIKSFVAYVQAEMPTVIHALGQLGELAVHLSEGLAPIGHAALSGLGVLAEILNQIPINVLTVLAQGALAAYTAFRVYSGIETLLKPVNAALTAHAATAVETAATVQAASAKTTLAFADEAATVAQAKAAEARAIAEANAAIVESSAGIPSLFDSEAIAATTASREITASMAGTASLFATEANLIAEASAREAASFKEAADAAVLASEEVAAAQTAQTAAVSTGGLSSAALGLTRILGPLAAVGIGVSLLTGLFRSNNDQAIANQKVMDGYAASLQTSSDALAAASIAQTNKNLQDDGALKLVDKLNAGNATLGLTYGQLALAVNGSQDQFNNLIGTLQKVADANKTVLTPSPGYGARGPVAAYNAQGQAAVDLIGKLNSLHGTLTKEEQLQLQYAAAQKQAQIAIDGGTTAVANQARAYGVTTDAYLAAQQAAQKNTDQTNAQTLAFQMANDAANLLKNSLDALSGKTLSNAQAQNAFEQQLVTFASAATSGGKSIDGMSQASIANRGNLIQLVTAAEAAAEAYGNVTHSSELGRERLQKLRQEILDNAAAQHLNTKEVAAFIDSILKIPASVPPTKAQLDTSLAVQQAKDLAAVLASILKTVHVQVVAQLQGTTPGSQFTPAGRAGAPLHPATGGYITGPGTGTSDSIPAMVSNGEYVVNAAQTAKHHDLLEQINKGINGFADGGIVTLNPKKSSKSGTKTKISVDSITVTAGDGAAYGIADIIRGNIPAAKQAMTDLTQAVNDAFQLRGVRARLAAVNADLKNLMAAQANLRSSVTGQLSGTVDASKYADIGGLLDAYSTNTGANQKFGSELSTLAKEGLNRTLLQQLAQAGPSAGLDSLAAASKSQINQVNSAFGAFNSSATAGGNLAANDVFGSQIAADRALAARLTVQQAKDASQIDRLVGAIAKLTGRPVEVKLDGKVIAHAVFASGEFQGIIDGLTGHLVH